MLDARQRVAALEGYRHIDVRPPVGLERSMLTVVLARALLPARSVATPSTVWLRPSLDTTTGSGHEATPDNASSHSKCTVTSVLLTPVAVGIARIVGGVRSTLSFT